MFSQWGRQISTKYHLPPSLTHLRLYAAPLCYLPLRKNCITTPPVTLWLSIAGCILSSEMSKKKISVHLSLMQCGVAMSRTGTGESPRQRAWEGCGSKFFQRLLGLLRGRMALEARLPARVSFPALLLTGYMT